MTGNSTISSILAESFQKYRERTALMPDDGFPQMTYGELYDRACRIASFLAENGAEPGKGIRVAISMRRNPAYVVSFMALRTGEWPPICSGMFSTPWRESPWTMIIIICISTIRLSSGQKRHIPAKH